MKKKNFTEKTSQTCEEIFVKKKIFTRKSSQNNRLQTKGKFDGIKKAALLEQPIFLKAIILALLFSVLFQLLSSITHTSSNK